MPHANGPVTVILREMVEGDPSAMDRLMPLVYAELHRLAGGYLRRERASHTLQPTALVNEAYLRLVGREQPEYRSRAHFFGIAAHVMRQVLVDHARGKNAAKRGGGQQELSLDESLDAAVAKPIAVIALDDALAALERMDPSKAKLIEMRFFGGMTAEESAQALEMPVERVRADLRIAQAWLQREMDRGAAQES